MASDQRSDSAPGSAPADSRPSTGATGGSGGIGRGSRRKRIVLSAGRTAADVERIVNEQRRRRGSHARERGDESDRHHQQHLHATGHRTAFADGRAGNPRSPEQQEQQRRRLGNTQAGQSAGSGIRGLVERLEQAEVVEVDEVVAGQFAFELPTDGLPADCRGAWCSRRCRRHRRHRSRRACCR